MSNTLAPATVNTPSLATVPIDLPIGCHKLLALRGQFVRIVANRPLKVRKGKAEIIKHSEYTVRIGCDYEALKVVKEGRESGDLPSENQGMWGEWIIFPILKSHKGNHYIRCTAVRNNDSCKPSVTFLRNGIPITVEEAKADALASEFYEKDLVVFDIKVESVESINGVPV